MVRISTAPISTMVPSVLMPASDRPFFSAWIRMRPSSVPTMVPRPPKIEVPPSTTAVMASSSMPVPMSERVVETRDTKITAASAAAKPEAE